MRRMVGRMRRMRTHCPDSYPEGWGVGWAQIRRSKVCRGFEEKIRRLKVCPPATDYGVPNASTASKAG